MTRDYKIERRPPSRFSKEISIHNFPLSNVYLELPIVERIDWSFQEYLVGFWKIKKLKV